MIRKAKVEDITQCVEVIKNSFRTVAEEFGFTVENAPGFTAFATTKEKLEAQYKEGRPMFIYEGENGKILGYYSLYLQENQECELNNLCVLPKYRHGNIGKKLMEHAMDEAKKMGCVVMNIGIVEENKQLRRWYESFGGEHIRSEKYEFFPFTCGYMRKKL